jgi:proteasome lid subunit RPN8/RPN11
MINSHLVVNPSEHAAPPAATMPTGKSRRWFALTEDPDLQPHTLVFVAQDAYLHLLEHASSDLEREVGGILVGVWSIDSNTRQQFIVIETALPARFTRQGSVFLTFTQDSLVDLHAELDENYPGKQIVGWYHTHPGLGVFLSPYDTWLHQHFFPEPWQVALVIDPHAITGGFFIRQADKILDPDHHYGFYELIEDSGLSIVRWNNLESQSGESFGKGNEFNE